MKILVTNDDGIDSLGLKILTQKLLKYTTDILVVAPSNQMSATSQKISLTTGLKVEEEKAFLQGVLAYKVNGTPCDCIRVAIHILNYQPDLIFSGANNGFNVGDDILYSGTVASCFEGALYNIKSVAISCYDNRFLGMKYFDPLLTYLFKSKIYCDSMILNINIPNNPKSLKITNQGRIYYDTNYIKKPNNLYYLQGALNMEKSMQDENADVFAIYNDIISITPLTTDRIDKDIYKKVTKVIKEKASS